MRSNPRCDTIYRAGDVHRREGGTARLAGDSSEASLLRYTLL